MRLWFSCQFPSLHEQPNVTVPRRGLEDEVRRESPDQRITGDSFAVADVATNSPSPARFIRLAGQGRQDNCRHHNLAAYRLEIDLSGESQCLPRSVGLLYASFLLVAKTLPE